MSRLILSVVPSSPEAGWTAMWTRDGTPVGPAIAIDNAGVAASVALTAHFSALFDGHVRPVASTDVLRQFGREIARLWIEPAGAELTRDLGAGPHDFVIHSGDPRVLNQPWELVELTPGAALGCDAGWSLVRVPVPRPTSGPPLEPGPLRILFVASAPTDQARLDYEREEDAMLRCTSHLPAGASVVIGELGTAEELAELVTTVRPHVVHLSGHGKVDAQGRGTFAFEDERGLTDSRTAEQIIADVFGGSPVRCVFWNGCETAQAAVAGLCQALVEAGLPQAIGWAAPVADDRATEFTREFYQRLVGGESTTMAAAHAREAIRRSGRRSADADAEQDATFASLQVYSSVDRADLFDRLAPRKPYRVAPTTAAYLGDGIEGLKEGFVGRRREMQRLIPALRDGETTVAVITGIGGQGKSTLATRTANRLSSAGFRVMPVRTAAGRTPEESASQTLSKLIDAMGRAFLRAERKDLHGLLSDAQIALDQRLRLAVDGLNEIKALFVLDNFEDALVLETRAIADADLASFYAYLATNLTQGSRLLVTSRLIPANTPNAGAQLEHVSLPELDHADFLKFLRRDERVDARLSRGELPKDLIATLFKTFGGTPGFLKGMRTVLATADPDELQAELEGDAGRLSAQRDHYYEWMFARRLFEALPSDARALVTCAAVSDLPLPLDGVASIAGLAEDGATRAIDAGVDYGLLTRFESPDLPALFSVPGVLRPWLASPDRLDPRTQMRVHGALATFWRASYNGDRENELRVSIDVELTSCREHARVAEIAAAFQWASVTLGRRLHARGQWRAALGLVEEVPEANRGAEWLLLAAIIKNDLGELTASRTLFEKVAALTGSGQACDSVAEKPPSRLVESLGSLGSGDADASRPMTPDQRSPMGINRMNEAKALLGLAILDQKQGRRADARTRLSRVVALSRREGDLMGEVRALHELASTSLDEGRLLEAREELRRVLALSRQIGDSVCHAAALHQIARVEVEEQNYPAARVAAAGALALRRDLGDLGGEARSLHQIATIDMRQGMRPAAREGFTRALLLRQKVGDRVGEGATLFQLGMLARAMGRAEAGVLLVAICWMIDLAVGHGDETSDLQSLLSICRELDYSQEQFDAMIEEARAGYEADRGQELIRKAFPDQAQAAGSGS
jgi:tetratricopeptide (TPR) repeat protein